MAEAFLGLGSNLGDRATLIAGAMQRLGETPGIEVTARSGLYRAPPWGDSDQGEFLNAAAAVETSLSPHALLAACLDLETLLGRVRGRRWGPRLIDIDVLHYAGETSADERLIVPHPYWRERAFVVVPLAEIAPDLVIAGWRVADVLAAIDTTGIVRCDAAP